MDELAEKKKLINEAFCDNFNTPLVLKHLLELISKTYEYEKKTQGGSFKLHLAYNLGQYVAFITKCFGLIYRTEFIDYFIYDTEGKTEESSVSPFIDVIGKFRTLIKESAQDKDLTKVLEACDELRDEILPQLGVKLEDRGKGKPSVWKLYDKDELLKEIQLEKEKREQDKLDKEKKAQEKELKLSTPAVQWYAQQTNLYSKFDETGLPTHDETGKEISKEIRGKLKKEFAKHEENHKKWLEKQQN
jgi:cysteinyl-tRNA synthetase